MLWIPLCSAWLVAGPANGVAESEPNGTPAQADATGAAIGTGAITPAGDVDFWLPPAAEVSALVFAFVEAPSGDPTLSVFAADGSTLIEADDDDGGGGQPAIAGAVVPQAGDVFYLVHDEGDDDTVASYALHQVVVAPGDVVTELEGNDSVESAEPLRGPATAGRVAAGDQDFFSFPASGNADLVVIVDEDPDDDGVPSDVRIAVLGKNGTTVLTTGNADPARSVNLAGRIDIPGLFGTNFVRITNGGGAPDDDYRFVVLVQGAPTFLEACCHADGSCGEIPGGSCAALDSVRQGIGSSCAETACPQPEPAGACCLAGCACEERSEAQCAPDAGRFAGFGSSCAQDCGVSVLRDLAAFEAAASGLVLEDFEELSVPPDSATGCGLSLPSPFCFSQPGDFPPGLVIEQVGGISIQGLAKGGSTPRNLTSDAVCAGGVGPTLDVVLPAGSDHAVAMQIFERGAAQVDVALLAEGDLPFADLSVFADGAGTFVGFLSDAPIRKVRLSSSQGMCLDDVRIGTLPDVDSDGVADDLVCADACGAGATVGCDDNCLVDANADQADGDGDAAGDLCDICPSIANVDQTDPSFSSLSCRTLELLGAVAAEPQLGALEATLLVLGQQAGTKLAQGEERCSLGKRKATRNRLLQAGRKLKSFAKQLRTRGPALGVPEGVFEPLAATADALRAAAKEFRSQLACPAP